MSERVVVVGVDGSPASFTTHTTTDRVIALLGAYSDALNHSRRWCDTWPTPPTQATSMLSCSCSNGCRSSPTRWITK
ncbi:MAG TPA: hypothetical protein VJT72_04130 [Pseudonocardiaceae bacterium]|nr:hypothetical protein [Pseudonocardiaceae bacterium]